MGEISYIFGAESKFEVLTCWASEPCGISFAMPHRYADTARRDGSVFHCPNGHRLRFGEGDVARLERERDNARRRLEWAEAREKELREANDHLHRSRNAYKGKLSHVKKRVGNGVCPCCNRTFQNLQRHMATKHPKFGEGEP